MSVTKGRAACGRLVNLRVLIVEDTWLIADTLAVVLESEGARVVGPTPTGSGAQDLLRLEKVDIALVDMSLSDGFADTLIEDLDARSIPYFIVTGFGSLPSDADARAIKVIRKPFEPGKIVDLLGNFIRSRSGYHG